MMHKGFSDTKQRFDLQHYLTLLVVLLAAVLVIVAGGFGLILQGDAHNALANAKTQKLALENISRECYAYGLPFADFTRPDGLAATVEEKSFVLSRAPGTLRLLQSDRSGYDILAFSYEEGPFLVRYQAEPLSWTIDLQFNLLDTVS